MFRWGSRGMAPKSASEVEDDRLLDELQAGFNAQNRKKQEQLAPSCAHCDDATATIPCVDQCGDAFYCSNECVLSDARRHRTMCLNLRLSLCGDDDEVDLDANDSHGDNADEYAHDGDEYANDGDEPSVVEEANYDEDLAHEDGEDFSQSVDNFSTVSVQHESDLHRVESIQVTCPLCDETAVITSKVLRREDSKQKVSTTCICGEVVGFWV